MKAKAVITNWDEVPVCIDIPYAARLLRFNTDYTSRLAAKGKIPARKVGNSWRIDKDELKELINPRADVINKLTELANQINNNDENALKTAVETIELLTNKAYSQFFVIHEVK
ncbi:helix-turn-helix domain-containing protein [Ruminococcus sp.]